MDLNYYHFLIKNKLPKNFNEDSLQNQENLLAHKIIKGSHVHFQHGIVLTTQSFENQNITETVYQILLNEKSNDSLRPFVTDQPSP